MASLSGLLQRYRTFREEFSFGWALRNAIHRATTIIHPYAEVVLPNFRAVHYFYIIFMVFLLSILVYPVKNISYIDVLFLTAGGATQAGLNTVNLGDLSLYQQIVIYIEATITTPIFIHGSLLFVRLYWFERHFDNIKESSKLNFKMRRNATLAARTRSVDSTHINTVNNQGLGFNPNQMGTPQIPSSTSSSQKDEVSLKVANTSPQSSASVPPTQPTNDSVTHISEPEDDSDDPNAVRGIPPEAQKGFSPSDTSVDPHQSMPDNDGIRFGNLPQPAKHRNSEIEPSDMYKSIAMLQNVHRSKNGQGRSPNPDGNEDGDVLVIKSPNEIEKDGNNPIFTKKEPQIQFSENKPVKKWSRLGSHVRGKKWSKLKRTLSGPVPSKPRRRQSLGLLTNDEDEDDRSIDSENEDLDQGTDFEDLVHGESDDADDESENAIQDDDDEENGARSSLETKDRRRKMPAPRRKGPLSSVRPKRKKSRRLLMLITPSFSRMNSTSGQYDSNMHIPGDSDEEYEYSEGDNSLRKVMSTNYLSWVPTVGRNSTFVHLSEEQKEELGGVEYRAVKLLIKILLAYFIGFHVFGFVCLTAWISKEPKYKTMSRSQGYSPTWWGFWTAQSSFNDLGLTLTVDSMQSFPKQPFVLIILGFLILIGNTAFPVFLRFLIWVLFKLSKLLSLFRESLGFLLDHPRRCFTLLFPSIPTWWLFAILVVLNGVDLVLFIVLDLHNNYLSEIPTGYRILDGLYQAFSTRTAGFSVVDISQLHPAVQVSYMIMMYISVLPLAISIRRTNVYEEQSLGVYLRDENQEDIEKTPSTYIGAHLRNQLSFDLWFIVLALFIICIAEGPKLNENNPRFSVFSILFEIISAYGTVGLSLGYPNTNESLSYKFTTLSKLVIIALMIRGRHRGLPYALDRAIMLPDDAMKKRDQWQESHAIRRNNTLEATMTNATDAASATGAMGGLRRAISRRASMFPGFDEPMVRKRSSFFSRPNDQRYVATTNSREEHELQDLRNMEDVLENHLYQHKPGTPV